MLICLPFRFFGFCCHIDFTVVDDDDDENDDGDQDHLSLGREILDRKKIIAPNNTICLQIPQPPARVTRKRCVLTPPPTDRPTDRPTGCRAPGAGCRVPGAERRVPGAERRSLRVRPGPSRRLHRGGDRHRPHPARPVSRAARHRPPTGCRPPPGGATSVLARRLESGHHTDNSGNLSHFFHSDLK